MPKSTPRKLAYQKAYNDLPEMRTRNMMQKRAWREAIKEGKIKPGDGKAVDHKRSLDDGGGNIKGNTRVVAASKNKGWRKGTSSYSPAKGRFNK